MRQNYDPWLSAGSLGLPSHRSDWFQLKWLWEVLQQDLFGHLQFACCNKLFFLKCNSFYRCFNEERKTLFHSQNDDIRFIRNVTKERPAKVLEVDEVMSSSKCLNHIQDDFWSNNGVLEIFLENQIFAHNYRRWCYFKENWLWYRKIWYFGQTLYLFVRGFANRRLYNGSKLSPWWYFQISF